MSEDKKTSPRDDSRDERSAEQRRRPAPWDPATGLPGREPERGPLAKKI